MTNINTTDTLKKLWSQQLTREYDEICEDFDIPLGRPVLEISEASCELGGWDQATRVLSISRRLIVDYPWAVTQQVLKHEMAHQMCSELLSEGGRPHGESFQQACELLGVLPRYRRHRVILPEILDDRGGDDETVERERRFLRRVEKLFALGQSTNRHEAELAIQKANEFIETHHLDQLLKEEKSDYIFLVINRKRKQIATYQRFISSILQDFFFVQVVLASSYDPGTNQVYKTIELFGTRENVVIAEYCYFFLENQLVHLWQQNKHIYGQRQRALKNSYLLGVVQGFYQKLEDQRKGRKTALAGGSSGELVVVENRRLQEFVAMRYPRLQRESSRSRRVNTASFERGLEAGKHLNFHEGLGTKNTSDPGLICQQPGGKKS